MKHWKTTALAVVTMSLTVGLMPVAAMAATVTVHPGDSLWKIAAAHNVSVSALETSNPSLNPADLLVGTTVQLPQTQSQSTYVVQQGDSLFLVARKFGVTLAALQSSNPGVNPAHLLVGQTLKIPGGTNGLGKVRVAPSFSYSPTSSSASASSADMYWMARIINAEAGNQSLQAKIAVGDVVWHRVQSPNYPNTVQGVVFQVTSGAYQFTPVMNGTIYNTPSAQSIQAAQAVLNNHTDLVPGAYVFYTPSKTPAVSWVRKQPYLATYDSMVFSV
ncbi:LysM peptidoglycan-binding domain-containing protein [Alicyclobacillus ferrooxydans]|nr:LysM peptidoglycan-binding domain-containing protein [Alicyclobacillus ferrooxydans]